MTSTQTTPKKSIFKSLSSTKVTKAELKTADIVTQELQKGFQWTTQHVQIVLGILAVALAGGVGWVAYDYFSQAAETKAQESYFKAEKLFQKQHDALNKPADKKIDNKTDSKEASKIPIPPVLSTGDFEKDYSTQSVALQKVISEFPGSAASRMAGLRLAAEQMKYNRADLALKTLEPVKTTSDLLSAMIFIQKGKAQAAQKDCKSAQDSWKNALALKSSSVFVPEIELQQGLCFEILGDKVKAEESYNKILASFKDSPYARTAEHYLRLLHR